MSGLIFDAAGTKPPVNGAIRAVVVDDSEAFLAEAARFLMSDQRIDVVGRASSGREALELLPRLKPDVALIDLTMPGIGGLETTRQIKQWPDPPRVVILTLHQAPAYVAAAREAGADAFVSKAEVADSLLPTIHELFPNTEPPLPAVTTRP